MKLFIWEGNGISAAYHDDGTLVVLANTAEEARTIMKELRVKRNEEEKEWYRKRDELIARVGNNPNGKSWTQTPEGKQLWEQAYTHEDDLWDGEESSIEREPDKVLDIDTPKFVAFNGGGDD